MRPPAEPRRDRRSIQALPWIVASFLLLAPAIGLVTPRARGPAEPARVKPTPESEPPPPQLVLSRPASRSAPAARDETATEDAVLVAEDAGEPIARPASTNHAPELVPLEIRVTRAGLYAPGAWVELLHEPEEGLGDQPRRLSTDERGRLHLRLAPGSVRVVAWSDDECARPASLTLALPQESLQEHLLELALEPAYPVAGRVTSALTGEPLVGARVSFWTFAECDTVTTGPDGVFRHPRFPSRAPAQQVVVQHDGFGRQVRYLRIKEGGDWKLMARTRDEDSVRGRGTPWIDLALVPELQVRGRVLDETGRALAGARVSAEGFFHALPSMASRDRAETLSDEHGAFELSGLRSDIGHSLLVQAPGHAELLRELESGLQAVDVETLTLVRETLITGTVIDGEGWPLAGVEVVLLVNSDAAGALVVEALDVGARIQGKERRTRTDAHGTFLFEGLPALACTLRAEHEQAGQVEVELVPSPDGSFVSPSLTLAARGFDRRRASLVRH